MAILVHFLAACTGGGGSTPAPTPTPTPAPNPSPTGASLVSCATMSTDIIALHAHHAADIAAVNTIAPSDRGARAVRSGAWSDAATWGGTVPSAGAVVIPAGVGVIVDARLSSTLDSVRVDGCLEFARNANTRLRTDLLYIAQGGEIWIGSPNAPIAPGVTAEIAFPRTGAIDVSTDPNLLGKGFVSASKTNIHGAAKTTKVRAATAPLKGATTIALSSAPSGWQVGDRVVLTGTYRVKFTVDANGIRRFINPQDEELTITAINGSSVTVTPALQFDHDGPYADLTPYLANFSRNVRIYTENAGSAPVHERGHTMFMSPQTVIRSAEFDDLGRTDKSRRAFAAGSITPPLPDSNFKGRYPLHLHRAGGPGTTLAADVRNVAVWGSPGWGIAQHSGVALLHDNAVYNAFGSSFVAESGDERGAWVSNIAIKSEGVAEIVKDGASVHAFDLARTGDGYWFQGRLLRIHDNIAAGMHGGNGFVFMNRGSDITDPTPIAPDMALQRASFRFVNQPIVEPNIQQFTDNEAFACKHGYHVTKPGPNQTHDSRSVIDGFTAWETEIGVQLTYVSGYLVKNARLIGSRNAYSWRGVDFAKNTYDLGVVDSRIEGFDYGVFFSHDWNTTFGPAAYYISANNKFSNIRKIALQNADANDAIMSGPAPAAPSALTFSWGANLPLWPEPNTGYLLISGDKSDGAGTVPFPMVSGRYRLSKAGLTNMLAKYGYYTLADGRKVGVGLEHFSNRVTGEIELASYDFEINTNVFKLDAFQDNGLLDLNTPAPKAANDSAIVQRNGSVVINATANDGAGGPFDIVGLTPARYGAAEITANGDILYAPYPRFTGTDSFHYWVRSSAGRVAKAKVTVTVQ